MPEYRPEDMVFEMEEEKIPIYKPPQPEGGDAEADADGVADGAEPENGGNAWRPSACYSPALDLKLYIGGASCC